MLLAIDVGNTQTVIGVFDDPVVPFDPRTASRVNCRDWATAGGSRRSATARRTSTPSRSASCWRRLGSRRRRPATRPSSRRGPHRGKITGVVVSSSVPSVTAALRRMVADWCAVSLVVVEPGIRTGMPILYDNPKEVGADRIVNAVGAIDLFGGPAIVVDFGTATTFDVISAAGEYLGGAIAPGLEISMDALFAHAAALRRVELVAPASVVGRSTVESMQSGAVFGHAALVDGLCRRIRAELGEATVIATGGLCGVVAPHTEVVAWVEPWLTLHGLRILYVRNASPEARDVTS